jgi:hypothetical protein
MLGAQYGQLPEKEGQGQVLGHDHGDGPQQGVDDQIRGRAAGLQRRRGRSRRKEAAPVMRPGEGVQRTRGADAGGVDHQGKGRFPGSWWGEGSWPCGCSLPMPRTSRRCKEPEQERPASLQPSAASRVGIGLTGCVKPGATVRSQEGGKVSTNPAFALTGAMEPRPGHGSIALDGRARTLSK